MREDADADSFFNCGSLGTLPKIIGVVCTYTVTEPYIWLMGEGRKLGRPQGELSWKTLVQGSGTFATTARHCSPLA